MDKKLARIELKSKLIDGLSAWGLELFGSELVEKNKWKLKPRDAISLYLIKKYHWTIEYCRSLSTADIKLALADELNVWRVPEPFQDLHDQTWRSIEKLAS